MSDWTPQIWFSQDSWYQMNHLAEHWKHDAFFTTAVPDYTEWVPVFEMLCKNNNYWVLISL